MEMSWLAFISAAVHGLDIEAQFTSYPSSVASVGGSSVNIPLSLNKTDRFRMTRNVPATFLHWKLFERMMVIIFDIFKVSVDRSCILSMQQIDRTTTC